jgi:hypothetical protein
MVARVHNARASDERCTEGWHHDDKGPPDLTLRIQDVKFRGKVERKVEETREGDCNVSVLTWMPSRPRPTTAVARGKALESILQNVVVCLSADVDGL